MASEKPLRWAIPVLGETGCRIAEIIGLRRSDVLPDGSGIRIVAHSARRLKTSGSERDLPLVGYAQRAMQKLLNHNTDNDFLFGTYLRDGEILATHAGNTLNKWLKQQTDGKTAHCCAMLSGTAYEPWNAPWNSWMHWADGATFRGLDQDMGLVIPLNKSGYG